MKDYKLMHNYIIRKVSNRLELEQAHKLNQDHTIGTGNNSTLLSYHDFDELPQTQLLIAMEKGEVIATNTLTTGDLISGLINNKEFKPDIDGTMHEKKAVATFFRFAIREDYRNDMGLLFSLIKESMRVSIQEYNTTICLMRLPSGHENFYKQYLGAETIVSNKSSQAILIRWDIEKLPQSMLKEIEHLTLEHNTNGQTNTSCLTRLKKDSIIFKNESNGTYS